MDEITDGLLQVGSRKEATHPPSPRAAAPARTLGLRATEASVPFVSLEREHRSRRAEFADAFLRVLDDGGFVLGEEVDRFEDEWAAASGASFCIGVASGTAALTLLLRAVGLGRGDEVIVPANSFAASAFAVALAGAVPVFCDVDAGSGLMDLASAEAVVGPRTAALLPVHLFGQMCDMRAVAAMARKLGLAVVEDAAQAHGARFDGQPPGALSDGAAYSFYPSKNLGALGDGGAVCTTRAAIAERVRRLRSLGQRRKGEHVEVAGNDRLDGVQAAILRVKLRDLAGANEARERLAARYDERLDGRVRQLTIDPRARAVHHLYPVRVAGRDGVAARLRRMGVPTGVHYTPALHQQPALAGVGAVRLPLPRAEAWARQELSLPMGPQLTDAEVDHVAHSLKVCLPADRAVPVGETCDD